MIETRVRALAETWIDPIGSIATAARTVAVRHETMAPEIRHEVLGLLYERTTEMRDAAIKLHSVCIRDLDLSTSRRAWTRPCPEDGESSDDFAGGGTSSPRAAAPRALD